MPEDFKIYRALQKIHLGATDPPEVIEKGEKILFNGQELKRESGETVKIRSATSLTAAITSGWIVPDSSKAKDFTVKAAGVEVRTAVSNTATRDRVSVMTVQDEERDMGSIEHVRPKLAPAVHKASDAGKTMTSRGALTGAKIVRDEAEGEGRVIGRLKNSAQAPSIEIGKDDQRITSSLSSVEGSSAVKIEKLGRAQATGDVQEARSGDELSELLPDAVSSKKPSPGVFKDEGVRTSSANSTVGGQEEGKVIGRVGKTSDPEAALRDWATSGQVNGQTLNLKEAAGLAKLVLRKLEGLRSELNASRDELASLKESSDKVPLNGTDNETEDVTFANVDTEIAEAVARWDLSSHWKTRAVKVVAEYGDQPKILQGILAIEAVGVQKAIQRRLEEIGESAP